MWRWTLKSLVSAALKLISSMAALACALLLAMLFEAIFAGEARQVVAYLDNADADVWVMQKGVKNMHMATSYLPDWKIAAVKEVEGVVSVEPILYLNTVINTGDKIWFSYVVGLPQDSSKAGPWLMAAGRAQPMAGEVIVPAVFREIADVELGDNVFIADTPFTVAGFAKGTFSMANTIIFVTKTDLEDLMTSLDIVSFILVEAAPSTDPDVLARRIEDDVGDISALPAKKFISNDRELVMQMGVETIALMTLIGGMLAVLLLGFTIYTQIAGLSSELAVIKALGASNASLYVSVTVQSMLVIFPAMLLALVLALLLAQVMPLVLPQVTLSVTIQSVWKVGLIGMIVGTVSALIAARQIAVIDPVLAFSR